MPTGSAVMAREMTDLLWTRGMKKFLLAAIVDGARTREALGLPGILPSGCNARVFEPGHTSETSKPVWRRSLVI